MKDFSQYKFRCSSLGSIMTDPRSKSEGPIGETCKAELIKIYVEQVYGRSKEIASKYVEKGLAVEEDSITLLSQVKDKYLLKNIQRFSNDFITGEPDVLSPLYDTKSCWDIHTFYAVKTKPLVKDYRYQMQGYCELTGASEGTVAFCLIDTPLGLIEDEKRKLFYKMQVPTMENPEYLEACEQLEKEMTFGDIPKEERVHEVKVVHDPELIDRVYERIILCRKWLNEFANKQSKLCTTILDRTTLLQHGTQE